ncbi:hypothetical protein I7I50_09636 [Histoplasma capsulatum G186AR]|uniref:PLAC8-domain-containing protein n=1 Tax=Ajellomyces capsulatus TaxID=5037 RepID=A0A8H7YRM0_AJECA|nr:hypothetical protein I7I52_07166 [Histoplasma capsulatum]QSS74450.1 hypothetical protein I7I50_09636 [Histoplasma capsulatum G186AR]
MSDVSQLFTESKWASALFDCRPFNICILGFCCPCFLFGKTRSRIKGNNPSEFTYWNENCCHWFCLSLCSCQGVIQALERTKIRNKFNIDGWCIGDWCGACCCPCCSLIQEEKEVLVRTQADGYQKVPGMTAGYLQRESVIERD